MLKLSDEISLTEAVEIALLLLHFQLKYTPDVSATAAMAAYMTLTPDMKEKVLFNLDRINKKLVYREKIMDYFMEEGDPVLA